MKNFDITAFGEILIDFTYIGDTEEGQKLFAQNAGGAPANVLVCAQKFGLQTAFLGKIGDDMHGDFLRKTLEDEHVNTQGLITDKNYFTTLAFVDINKSGERSFSFARKHGADTFMQKEDINLDILKKSKIFHVGSLSLTTELSTETTLFALKKAKDLNLKISYDPNYRSSLWENEETAKTKMQFLIKYADYMKISDEECLLLTGTSDVKSAAKILYNMGVKIICITLGDKGAYVFTNGYGDIVKGFKPQKVIDTTGAGDSFWGAFLSEIIKANKKDYTLDDVKNFARVANATASLCVEKSGAIRAMPDMNDINIRLSENN